ncbi:phosphatase PAP2 family protein [Rubrobacter taiwanensis]|uniref:Phosphatase PAP2 family protein n=1 Tax=Rubrobacter taiwanensis TaxID=185139 RepID=A0A4R1BJ57_9ACTN|nr:diacylglycerol kinase [Rubrobacter taiwanensis]TCJ17314.1 phosphatase PAP2 family protein [Rubrobacter taiwanensis]
MSGDKTGKKQQNVARSLNHAYQGIIYVIRTQRNMRFHAVAALMVLVLSLLLNVSRLELAVLVIVIMAVFVTEMFNTAMEFAVDLVTREYHPLAKLAKDVAAGAVLVASVSAVAVGYLVLADKLGPFSMQTLQEVRSWPGHLTLVALVLVSLLVIIGKALTRSPNSFLGGMPSGHAAAAFAAWVVVSFLAAEARYGGLISIMALLMALLVCQSRVEAGIHSIYQVVVGAVLGILVSMAVFQLAG